MIRALWLSNAKSPKQFSLDGEEVMIIAIKNSTLKERLLPTSPEIMTIKSAMDWAELVRRVATGYGANTVLLEASMALQPLVLTLQHTLKPYRVSLRSIE